MTNFIKRHGLWIPEQCLTFWRRVRMPSAAGLSIVVVLKALYDFLT
jgi:hypothetical protein